MERRSALAIAAACLAFATARAGSSSAGPAIEPGPAVITPEEAAIVADPKAGIQHGVVLLEEIDYNENHTTNNEYAYHMRAKILSPEARDMGNIVIGGLRSRNDLEKFWARTILPDGAMLGLIEGQLEEHTTVKVQGVYSTTELRGALPGIVPGCVIDVGYVVRGEGYAPTNWVSLQGPWPIRTFRYRWVPSRYGRGAYATSNVAGKDVTITADKKSVLIVAHDLEPIPDEPFALPDNAERASVILYYTDVKETPEKFWDETARDWDAYLRDFAGKGEGVRDAIARIGASPDAPLDDRLRAAYAWVQANVANVWQQSAEGVEAPPEPRDPRGKRASDQVAALIGAKKGTTLQINLLFAAIARGLGAQAHMLYVPDRTRGVWIRSLKRRSQFVFALVAVRDPTASGGYTILSPGSGLPYGQLLWSATGATGLLATADGAVDVTVPPGSPESNHSTTRATVAFVDDGHAISVHWSRSSPGGGSQDAHRTLRELSPENRTKAIERLCRGASTGATVVSWDAPHLEDLDQPLQFSCDLDLGESSLAEDASRYTTTFKGLWWPETPYFPSPKRERPVVFAYPFRDDVVVDVTAPPGFRPLEAVPPTVDRTSPDGGYRLSITVRGNGYHVERELTVSKLTVSASDYPELRALLQAADDGDRTPLVFERASRAP